MAEAILAYRTAISLEPEEAKFRFGRAEAYIRLDRYTLAIDDYTEVIRLDPNFDLIYLRRGTAYLVLSDTERSISDFDEAIRLAPDKAAGAYAGRARVLTLRGRHTEAQEAVERAVELGLDAGSSKRKSKTSRASGDSWYNLCGIRYIDFWR